MYNFTFLLKTKEEGILPAFTGPLIRGSILNAIKQFDLELSDRLHESNYLRPYSISPLIAFQSKTKRTRRGEIIIEKESIYKFRLGLLTNELAERMVKLTLQKDLMVLKLANIDFKVITIEISKNTTKELLASTIENPSKLTLSFITPTYFTMAKQDFPMRFPDPRYLFMNLTSLWNAFNEEIIIVDKEAFFQWIENHVSINAYKLSTHTVFIAKGARKIGFKGWTRFQLSGEESYQRWIHALAQFAEFSNIGANRTAGLGCVRYKPKGQF
ncbi:MAG: CRISPR-associated endoribonuclease Cas6 [Candidatus Heimdallarchaeota archaeon]